MLEHSRSGLPVLDDHALDVQLLDRQAFDRMEQISHALEELSSYVLLVALPVYAFLLAELVLWLSS